MHIFRNLESQISARDTPAGRQFETSIVFYDCLILIVGCIGLAVSFPPLIYAAAGGHIVANFLMAPVKWVWPLLEAVTLAIATVLFFAAVYAVQVYYYGFPSAGVIGYLRLQWPQLLASTIVVAGIIGNLLAYPGNLDQLREHLDKA